MFEQPFYDEQELIEMVNMQLERVDARLNETDRRILAFFVWHHQDPYRAHLTIEMIAEETGRSERSVHRSLRKLENYSIVERYINEDRPDATISLLEKEVRR